MNSRITSIVVTGKTVESTVHEKDVFIKKAIEKWGHRWPESTSWSDRPDDLVADFVRAVSEDLLNEYGNQAVVRAGQLLAGNAVTHGKKNLTFSEIGEHRVGKECRL